MSAEASAKADYPTNSSEREKMKRLTCLLIIISVVLFLDFPVVLAYEPAVQWEKTFGGTDYDGASSVQQTSDGGYIIAGWTRSFGAGDSDVYLIKTDPNGNSIWQMTSDSSSQDFGYSVQQTSDGGYIISGAFFSNVCLIKTDSDGNSIWEKYFGGSYFDIGYSVQQTMDGGYIIAGRTSSFGAGDSDVYLIKTDPNGDSIWEKTFGGSDYEFGQSVHQTSDGGYIIAGSTRSFGVGESDVYLVKTDSDGNSTWEKTFGGSDYDVGSSVQQTSDGGYIIAGWTKSFGAGGYDIYIIKADSDGNLLWQKALSGSGQASAESIQQTSDGGYIIAGSTTSFGAGYADVYLIKLSSEDCQYLLFGDVNNDCRFDFYDFATMAENWLIDCRTEVDNPACIPK